MPQREDLEGHAQQCDRICALPWLALRSVAKSSYALRRAASVLTRIVDPVYSGNTPPGIATGDVGDLHRLDVDIVQYAALVCVRQLGRVSVAPGNRQAAA